MSGTWVSAFAVCVVVWLSVVQGRVAVRLAARLKFEKDTRAAKSIQKAWHSLVDW